MVSEYGIRKIGETIDKFKINSYSNRRNKDKNVERKE